MVLEHCQIAAWGQRQVTMVEQRQRVVLEQLLKVAVSSLDDGSGGENGVPEGCSTLTKAMTDCDGCRRLNLEAMF